LIIRHLPHPLFGSDTGLTFEFHHRPIRRGCKKGMGGCVGVWVCGRGGDRGFPLELLGELRAEEATGFLVEHIAIVPPGEVFDPGPEGTYPAAGALIRIGYPSVRTILREGFRRPRSEQEQKLMAYVIERVLGGKIGAFAIQDHLETLAASNPHKPRLMRFKNKYFPRSAKE
jgi:hypothetical protein